MPVRYAAAAALVLLVAAGCGGDATEEAPTPAPSSESTRTTEPAQPATIDWQPVPGPVEDSVTSNGAWTLTVSEDRREATLESDDSGSASGGSGLVSDALLTDTHALVVHQDPEEMEPARAVLTELATGEETVLDGGSEVPTTTGGTWALGPDTLVHATVGPGRAYCLATVDLATGEATRGWCAPRRHGFTDARITAAGTTLQTFDDSRPSCRTVVTVEGTELVPFPDAPDCTAWDGLVLDSGQVWSVVRKENDVERVDLFATGPDGGDPVELGPGTSGTLVACGDAAYVVRDPQGPREPARLVRWDGTTAETVYESPAGPAFLDTPRCGGDVLTVTAYAEGGDEQVTATVG